MATTDELQQLLRSLDERDIALGHDDVAWAFEHEESEPVIRTWVQEFLSPGTLLSKEELHLYGLHCKLFAMNTTDHTQSRSRHHRP